MSNNKIEVKFVDLPNIGVMSTQIPTDMLAYLNSEIETMISSNFKSRPPSNHTLLGHMQHEYDMSNCIPTLEPYILYLIDLYNQKWHWIDHVDEQYSTTDKQVLKLTNLWANIQKKHEFNPPHEHTGVISFTIWIKIPYDLAKETAVFPPVSGNANRTSKFTFHYSNLLGQHSHYMIEVDKDHEGTLCMFPSKLNHSVNPFYTSDEYRISVAGNVRIVPA